MTEEGWLKLYQIGVKEPVVYRYRLVSVTSSCYETNDEMRSAYDEGGQCLSADLPLFTFMVYLPSSIRDPTNNK